MTNPVPTHPTITTPYGKRGSHWSSRRDSHGNGIHTGVDFAAPVGTIVVAARAGTVRHVNYGSAFGRHQVAVVCADGTEDFYAHMRSRVANGTRVGAGAKIGEVGAEGNVTGAHLHFERHTRQGHWNCDVVTNPQPSIDAGSDERPAVRLANLRYGLTNDDVKDLQRALNAHFAGPDLPLTGYYGDQTDALVRKCQYDHDLGEDAPKHSFVGNRQASHLGLRVIT
jgi:murein DD-endopeptidase MepM/ murein hydrolase activator NlpD